MTDLPLTGGCGCGAVRYEIDEQPVVAGYCHCTRCQRRTGTAAALSAAIEPGSMRILRGEDALGRWEPEGGWPKVFCSRCGSALWAQSPSDPGLRAVRMGSFDRAPDIKPSYRQFVDSAASWEPIPHDGVPRYPGPRST
jgi:hypothetical protein